MMLDLVQHHPAMQAPGAVGAGARAGPRGGVEGLALGGGGCRRSRRARAARECPGAARQQFTSGRVRAAASSGALADGAAAGGA